MPDAATACQLCAGVPGTHVAVVRPTVGDTQLMSATSVDPPPSAREMGTTSAICVIARVVGSVPAMRAAQAFSGALHVTPPTCFRLRCITSAHCHESSKNQMVNLDEIREDLAAAYRAIGEEFPDITVRVLGYPQLMQGNGRCDGVTGISGDEADWIDDQVDLLNHEIEVATARARGWTGADIVYVDVTDGFDNHGACRFWQRDRYVNDAVFGDTFRRSQLADGTVSEHWTDGPLNFSTASFHPSSKGYDAYLGALRSSIAPSLLPTR